jgi:hypothetical protein
MSAYTKARLIAVLSLGCALCAWLMFRESGQFLMGKAAYLADAAEHWDNTIAHPPGLVADLITTCAVMAAAAAVYEVISQMAERILARFFPAGREEKC